MEKATTAERQRSIPVTLFYYQGNKAIIPRKSLSVVE
jgi:hypothetical protein